ncbi:MAG: phosphoglucosamine mutase, partial [Thiomicrorhabdus sp.]|nr:phosphoglucosamine mutase [Thiomicrorhabdus sp.]
LYILATASEHAVSAVSGTVMSNLGLESSLRKRGVELHRTSVGDRYVMDCLLEKGLCFGAEPSGHVLCLDKITTGDGIVAALQVLSILVNTGQSLSVLTQSLEIYPQVLKNIHVESAVGLQSNILLQEKVISLEKIMGNDGRILIRASGTEPLIRVMVEGKSAELVEKVAVELANLVKSEFS